MNYCLMTLDKLHSFESLAGREKHNFRKLPLKHVDTALSINNDELVNDTGLDYRDLWHRRVKEFEAETGKEVKLRGRKGGTTYQSVLAYEVVMTYSKDAVVDTEQWKAANVAWLQKTFGEKNILSAQYHEDESTPHIHAIVIPLTEDGRLCARDFTGGKAKLKKLQSDYAKAMEPFGLSRGEEYTKSKKIDLQRFYSALNKAADAKAPELEEGESALSYRDRVNTYIQDLEISTFREKTKAKRQVEVARSHEEQLYHRYSEAIALHQDLMEKFDGNEDMVHERLRTYREIEHAVPRKILAEFLDKLKTRFPLLGNLRSFEWDRRKKRKKEVQITAGTEDKSEKG